MSKKRVLVVDDEIAIQTIIQCCLEDIAGWEVLVASSGQAGLKLAESEHPDGILLDVSMPQMTGIETLEKLQANVNTQHIPVIFVTAKVQPEDREQFSQLGILGILVKPFNPMILVNEVADLFGWQV
ncbi:response regulator [Dolichospermum sp. ST_con]|nr:response regulator [Dolichospermum sp. ST_con]MDD1422021.1 response regulator [Dolichospermum sp. ST_sed1]MDD1423912.1 response regulator [Dolichospermum sp. ST_sed9]MDD1430427.1 response regulator [Dolichospermum sp. ST_sed6]MDD1439759.1 response regulator [Dolichospermum sp. ST_sed3]MDD1445647.1 response regulator [Dolichospermum sp. ST_sed8]MDD1453993.1 response regulator [Dolichospermum sp. ST_sed7]MDD1459749.1 response regulator [Dolichospermum sp. ST_sed2]MDD1465070.1 response regu